MDVRLNPLKALAQTPSSSSLWMNMCENLNATINYFGMAQERRNDVTISKFLFLIVGCL